ncbi:MAG TPA: PAS domain S-box protein [Pyrinomonadaceae bacterium]|nr:PAS domain S-box protein [Pyrinomonadaceae bacterium]
MTEERLRVLIVEDVDDDAALLVRHLNRAGYAIDFKRVDRAGDFSDSLQDADWDVIISDFSLPGFTGLDALEILKAHGRDIPFIIISGTIGEETAVAAMKAGAADYLMKDNLTRLVPAVVREIADAEERHARREAERSLALSEERYRIVAETASDAIITIDAASIIRFANSATERIFGYKAEEIIGQPTAVLMPEQHRGRHIDALKRYLLTGQRSVDWASLETDAVRKDGSEISILISFGEHIHEGEHSFTAIIRDITQRKKDEDKLRQSEEDFRGLVEATTQFVWQLDPKGNLTEFPQWWVDLTGQPYEVSLNYGWTEYVHPDDREEVHRSYVAALESREPVVLTLRLRDRHGNYGHYAARAVPIFNDDGTFRKWICSLSDITERMNAEEALRESEARYRELFDSANDIIYTQGLDEKFTSINAAAFAVTGYQPEEIIGKDLSQLVAPGSVEKARLMTQQKLSAGGSTNYELEIIRKDGATAVLEVSSKLIFEDGKPAGIQGIARDITARKQAEELVRERDRQLATLIENLPGVVYRCRIDQNYRMEFINEAVFDLTGYPQEDFLEGDRIFGELIPEKDRLEMREFVLGELKNGDRYEVSYPVVGKSGDERWVYDRGQGIFDQNGNPYALEGFIADITERRNSQEALRRSEQQLRVVTDTVPALITYFDRDLICRFENKYYLEWLGRPEISIIGLHLREVVGPVAYEGIEKEFMIALAGNEFTVEREAHLERVGSGGRSSYLRVSYVPDLDKDGNVIGAFAFAIDLTETKRAEEALQKSREQLVQSQKLESVGRLAGGIAHDFNNMLTAITGYSELALRKLPADDPVRKHIEEIKKAGERSAQLTNQLLAFSRRQILQAQVVNINDVIQDTSRMLKRLIGEDISLEAELAEDLLKVKCDPGQLSQIIVNLVVNARDAMPEGGTILIETNNTLLDAKYSAEHVGVTPGDYVIMTVSDTGVGMDDETKKHVFEPFFTTKDVGKGTGLGLSTVYGIVKQSEGNVWIYSEPGRGTTVKVYLPVADVDSPIHRTPQQTNDFRFGTERILLVEDEDSVRRLTSEMLRSCGYTVVEANDGAEALAIYRRSKEKFDLIFTDVVMPQMSGRELADRVLEIDPKAKILFTSGYTDNVAVRQGVLDETTNFISKPFSFLALATKIRESIESE